MVRQTLSSFLNDRLTVDGVPHEDDEHSPPAWEPGTTIQVKEETYYAYLDLLPPRFLDGNLFAFGEGCGAWSMFWIQDGSFYLHHLSEADTETFRQLAGLASTERRLGHAG